MLVTWIVYYVLKSCIKPQVNNINNEHDKKCQLGGLPVVCSDNTLTLPCTVSKQIFFVALYSQKQQTC